MDESDDGNGSSAFFRRQLHYSSYSNWTTDVVVVAVVADGVLDLVLVGGAVCEVDRRTRSTSFIQRSFLFFQFLGLS